MPSLATIKLILMLVGAAALTIGSAVITHKVDQANLMKIEAGYKDAQLKAVEQAKAIQAAEDKVSLEAAVAEAAAQQQIVTVTQTLVKEVPIHVPFSSKCPVTVGFVRLLNAAVRGQPTADLSFAAGKPDDACAPIDARTLAGSILVNYAASTANSEQLGALQDWVRKTIEASKGTSK